LGPPGHRFLYQLYLNAENLPYYEKSWFLGFPLFALYGPGAYAIIDFFAFFCPAGADAFDISIYCYPYVVLFVFAYFVGAEKKHTLACAAPIVGLLYLTVQGKVTSTGVGLHGLIAHGLMPAAWGFVLVLIFLGGLIRYFEHRNLSSLFVATLSLCLQLYVHFQSVFFCLVLLLFSLPFFAVKERIRLLVAVSLAVALAFPFLREVVTALPYSSAEKIGLTNQFADAVSGLLPGLLVEELVQLGLYLKQRDFVTALGLYLPLHAVLFAAFFLVGLFSVKDKTVRFVANPFIAGLLLLPGFLVQFLPLSFHAYRFIQPLYAPWLYVACFGLAKLLEELSGENKLRSQAKLLLVSVIGSLLLLSAISFQFSVNPSFAALGLVPAERNFSPQFQTYGKQSDERKLKTFFGSKGKQLRVAVESSANDFASYGSPHRVSTLLSDVPGVEVLPGLLAESSLSSPYAIEALAGGSRSLLWGRTLRKRKERFSVLEGVERLRLLAVDYVVASSKRYKVALRSLGLPSVFNAGELEVFKLQPDVASALATNFRPLLYIDRGGLPFKYFNDRWFVSNEALRYPVLHLVEGTPTELERSQLGGFIVSSAESEVALKRFLADFDNEGKPLLVIHPHAEKLNIPSVPVLSATLTGNDLKQLSALLDDFCRQLDVFWEPLEVQVNRSGFKIKSQYSVIVKYSFSPRFKSTTGNVYWASPSFIWSFAAADGAQSRVLQFIR